MSFLIDLALIIAMVFSCYRCYYIEQKTEPQTIREINEIEVLPKWLYYFVVLFICVFFAFAYFFYDNINEIKAIKQKHNENIEKMTSANKNITDLVDNIQTLSQNAETNQTVKIDKLKNDLNGLFEFQKELKNNLNSLFEAQKEQTKNVDKFINVITKQGELLDNHGKLLKNQDKDLKDLEDKQAKDLKDLEDKQAKKLQEQEKEVFKILDDIKKMKLSVKLNGEAFDTLKKDFNNLNEKVENHKIEADPIIRKIQQKEADEKLIEEIEENKQHYLQQSILINRNNNIINSIKEDYINLINNNTIKSIGDDTDSVN